MIGQSASCRGFGYRVIVITGAVVAVVALSACGGKSAAKTSTATVSDANAAEFGLSDADIERRQIKVEALIQKCMKSQGFEYMPVDPATVRAAMSSNSKPSGVTDQQFARDYGYGVKRCRSRASHSVEARTLAWSRLGAFEAMFLRPFRERGGLENFLSGPLFERAHEFAEIAGGPEGQAAYDEFARTGDESTLHRLFDRALQAVLDGESEAEPQT